VLGSYQVPLEGVERLALRAISAFTLLTVTFHRLAVL
jgi:hypothetical protein